MQVKAFKTKKISVHCDSDIVDYNFHCKSFSVLLLNAGASTVGYPLSFLFANIFAYFNYKG